MRCYRHRDTEAVGTCKSCSKGLCGFCAVEVGHSLACRDECETDVAAIDQVVAKSIKLMPATQAAYSDQPRNLMVFGGCTIFAGCTFIALGSQLHNNDVVRFGISGLGLLGVLLGIFFLRCARKLGKELPQPKSTPDV